MQHSSIRTVGLAPGSRLGACEVLTMIGSGGMGEVYRARDHRLDRDVAIKILPQSVAMDPGRVARFEREAKTLAALNHPGIAQIHGFDDSTGIPALVMELVEGPTLAERIATGPIPLDEALPIARQIAEALEAAHEQGIIHRDLKPANIKVRSDGTVKLLDFGLAKAFEPAAGPPSEASVSASLSPTLSLHATQAGIVLGTAAYMAPEQARGKAVDRRADIWAFGVVLFEVLTGEPMFGGQGTGDTLVAVLTKEPAWAALPAATPPALRQLLRRCLERDPRRRLQAIGDARLTLEEHAAGVSGDVAAGMGAAPSSPWRRALPWTVAAVAVMAALLAVTPGRARPASPAVTRLELTLPPDVELYSITNGAPIAIAPDGHALAFIGTRAGLRTAFLRLLDQADTKPLTGAPLAMSVFFSPDNSALAVMASDGTLKKLTLSDGLVNTLVRGLDYNSGGAFGPDGRAVFTRDGALWQLSPPAPAPKPIAKLDAGRQEVGQQWPIFLPGGRIVLFTSYVADKPDAPSIDALVLADGSRRRVIERAVFPIYTPTGHLIFYRDGALLAVPFDARQLQTTGAPVRVAEQVAISGSGAPMAAVSDTGTLVYAPGGEGATNQIVWVARDGAETTLTDTPRHYSSPHLSPDGRRIAIVNESNGLWIQDTVRPVFTRLTSSDTSANYPVWTPDGQRVVYRSATGIRWIQADGSGQGGGAIAGTSQADYPCSVTPDGGTLVFLRVTPESSGDLYLLSLRGDPNIRPFVKTPAYEGGPQFSPDGNWVAYTSNESGPFQVYVRPFPGPDRRVQVSTDGGSYPLWSRKGNELFYRNGNRMMAVQIATGSRDTDPVISAPRQLFDRKYAFVGNTIAAYDVSADGQRFAFVRQESGANRLNVVLGWFEELKQRVPVK